MSEPDDVEPATSCPHCHEELPEDVELGCPHCGEPLDDPLRGICAFCGVATSERCGGCDALVCWECSDATRSNITAGPAPGEEPERTPYCPDCAAVHTRGR